MKINRVACQFVDAADGRPVPLVIVMATDNTTFVSDNAGYIVIPVNLSKGTPYYLSVKSAGYEVPADAFGYRGFQLTVRDAVFIIKLRRQNIAQRSGRITGTGKYIHAQTLGKYLGLQEQNLTGMDSIQTVEVNGTRTVFYGDTNWSGYPLGNFKTTNGTVITNRLPLPNCPYQISCRIDKRGNASASFPNPSRTPGVIWISGVVRIGNDVVGYANHRRSLEDQLDHGFVRWNPKTNLFEDFVSLPAKSWKHLDSHPVLISNQNAKYVTFGHAIPNFRVPADVDAVRSGDGFETFTCLLPNGVVDRSENGRSIWRWRKDGTPIDAVLEQDLISNGKLALTDCRFIQREWKTNRIVIPHRGTVRWNQYLNKWVLIFTAINEPDSNLGEVFISASDSLYGPWSDCIKIVTHPRYSYYNPIHHDWLDQDHGRVITIEGTYTLTFSGNTIPTPGYEYNQLAYQLDLSDERLQYLRKPCTNAHKEARIPSN